MDIMKRFGLIAVVTAIALLVPTRAASNTPPPTIEVSLSLTDLPAPIVNLSVPESQPNVNITVPETPAPVVNLDMPAPIVNVDVESQEPQVIYQDREVEVERIVEVPACLDYADLPYFDLANALSVAFPGEPWSLNGSHYNGLVWHGETPQPDMTAIIGGWLTHLTESC